MTTSSTEEDMLRELQGLKDYNAVIVRQLNNFAQQLDEHTALLKLILSRLNGPIDSLSGQDGILELHTRMLEDILLRLPRYGAENQA